VDSSSEHRRGLNHALDLANRGWKIVPYLDRPDNTQLKGWPDLATNDTQQIVEWFDAGQPYEDEYVGVVPALVDTACIDLDVHEGKANGFETLKSLGLSDSAMVTGVSRSGNGKHLWFKGTGISRPIYAGVDRKSIRGLVRVPYLLPPVEDVYETLPKAFSVFDSPTSGVEYLGSLVSWLDAHEGKPLSPKVKAALDNVPTPFRGHDVMLRVQTSLIKLATEGHGGVSEALHDLMKCWVDGEHTSGTSPKSEWVVALSGAVTAFGGAPLPQDYTAMHPDCFFNKSRILSEKLALAVMENLAIGHDNLTWVYSDGVWRPSPQEIEGRVFRLLRDRYDPTFARTAFSAVTVGIGVPRLPQQPDSRYINLQNCMLDWETGQVLEHAPDFHSTIQMNFEYRADAQSPLFDQWLEEVLPSELHPLFWEFFGYMFMVGNPKQRAVLLFGRGGTGKSTFLRLLENMLGAHNVSNVTLRGLSQGVFDRAQLYGKIANIAGDIDSKFLEDSSGFKQITGEDRIQAQHKHQQLFNFQSFAVPVFSANKLWRSNDTSDGYFRRWMIIPFDHQVDRSKPFNEKAIQAEASGIFNKALLGLQRMMDRGDFLIVGDAQKIFDEFKNESDVVRQWLRDDDMVEEGSPAERTERKDAYDRYRTWSIENGFKPSSSVELYKSLTALGIETKKSNGYMYFIGLKIDLVPKSLAGLFI
jgi:putative DNA primase/helicase